MDIIQKCLKQGWWLTVSGDKGIPYNGQQYIYYLTPPDHRRGWSTEWRRQELGPLIILIPHYASEEI